MFESLSIGMYAWFRGLKLNYRLLVNCRIVFYLCVYMRRQFFLGDKSSVTHFQILLSLK